jgi:hypothetical protein
MKRALCRHLSAKWLFGIMPAPHRMAIHRFVGFAENSFLALEAKMV